MKTVAVLGGGPAGAFAAERLARSGLHTRLFDEKLAWEKPCGGGLTYKAYHQYPFLIENDTPKRLVREWLASRDEDVLFSSSAGQSPSLADIVKMVHPTPSGPTRGAF